MLILSMIVALGMWAPWVEPQNLARRVSTLEWLALGLSRTGLASFSVSTPVVIVFGAVLAAVSVVFRVWGAAYLGYTIVHHENMQAGAVMVAGPYRYVRNPLYLGAWFMMAALSLLITPSGALLMLVLISIFLVRLILGEEAFLSAKLGEPYQQYLRAVPRLVPRFRTNLPHVPATPHWIVATLTEIMPIGLFVTLACVSWTYDNGAMLEAVFISLVASLIMRGLMKNPIPTIAFVVVAPAAWGLFHLSIVRALLIGLGAAIVVGAITPKERATSHPA